jgi:thiamine phosphate synthase YjbQ (UPF0047 family)
MVEATWNNATNHTNTHPRSAAADLYDITRQVEAIVSESKVQQGLVNVYAQGATAGIMI